MLGSHSCRGRLHLGVSGGRHQFRGRRRHAGLLPCPDLAGTQFGDRQRHQHGGHLAGYRRQHLGLPSGTARGRSPLPHTDRPQPHRRHRRSPPPALDRPPSSTTGPLPDSFATLLFVSRNRSSASSRPATRRGTTSTKWLVGALCLPTRGRNLRRLLRRRNRDPDAGGAEHSRAQRHPRDEQPEGGVRRQHQRDRRGLFHLGRHGALAVRPDHGGRRHPRRNRRGRHCPQDWAEPRSAGSSSPSVSAWRFRSSSRSNFRDSGHFRGQPAYISHIWPEFVLRSAAWPRRRCSAWW